MSKKCLSLSIVRCHIFLCTHPTQERCIDCNKPVCFDHCIFYGNIEDFTEHAPSMQCLECWNHEKSDNIEWVDIPYEVQFASSLKEKEQWDNFLEGLPVGYTPSHADYVTHMKIVFADEYRQFLEDTVDDAEYNAYLEWKSTPSPEEY